MLDKTLPTTRKQVKNFLPHRDPFLFIDQVKSCSDTSITAVSYVDPKMDVFKGHFPDKPIMPGVLLIETVAQAGALLIALNRQNIPGQFTAFSGVEMAKFRRPVYPGDTLDVHVNLLRSRGGFFKFEGTASVNGHVAATLKFAASQMSL